MFRQRLSEQWIKGFQTQDPLRETLLRPNVAAGILGLTMGKGCFHLIHNTDNLLICEFCNLFYGIQSSEFQAYVHVSEKIEHVRIICSFIIARRVESLGTLHVKWTFNKLGRSFLNIETGHRHARSLQITEYFW